MSLPQPSLQRMPALDGLRAIAVGLVMLTHFGKLQVGWIGVHLFFVISGFLITGILLHEREAASGLGAYLRRFFWRRSLRIFPAYYLYLAFLFLMFALAGLPKGLLSETPWLLGYVLNWHQSLVRPVVGQGPELGHLWSLCVEEQFYLVWPFLIFLVPRRALGPVLVGVVVLGPLLRWIEALEMVQIWKEEYIEAQSLYSLTPTHLDALALGGVIAYFRLHERIRRPVLWLLGALVAFVAIGVVSYLALVHMGVPIRPSSLGYTYNTLHLHEEVWSYTVINLAMAAWLLVAVGPDNRIKGWLSTPVLMRIGVVSYGMYLWHQLVLLLVDRELGFFHIDAATPAGLALRFGLFALGTVLWAGLLYRFFERPILLLKDRFGHRQPVAV